MTHFRRLLLTILLGVGFFSSCSHLAYQPSKNLFYVPEQFELKGEEVSFQSADGTTLYGWVIKPKDPRIKPKGWIIQFHGNAENMSSHFTSLAWMVRAGYWLTTFDYRGYGRSQGKPSPKGLAEDSVAALEWSNQLRQRQCPDCRWIAWGQSLGGNLILRAIQEKSWGSQFSLVIIDSSFKSYKSVGSSILRQSAIGFLVSWLPYLAMTDRYAFDARKELGPVTKWVLHDRHDQAVPFANGKALFDSLSEPKRFWEYDLGRHVGSFAEDCDREKGEFLASIEKHLQLVK